MRRRAGSGASRRSHHAHAWRWCACGSRSGGRGASSSLAWSRVCFKNPVVRACWGRASGARAAGISAGGCQTRGAGKPCARLGEVCALEGPPLGAPWGRGDGCASKTLTLEHFFAKNGFVLWAPFWVKSQLKYGCSLGGASAIAGPAPARAAPTRPPRPATQPPIAAAAVRPAPAKTRKKLVPITEREKP